MHEYACLECNERLEEQDLVFGTESYKDNDPGPILLSEPKGPAWRSRSYCKKCEFKLFGQHPTQPYSPEITQPIRTFSTGATRNADTNKYDFEGFLSPLALRAFGAYMHEHRHQKDGTLRDSDNWQRGITAEVYLKSGLRHTFDWWSLHRGYSVTNPDTGKPVAMEETLCAVIFNAMGRLHELKKSELDPTPDKEPAKALETICLCGAVLDPLGDCSVPPSVHLTRLYDLLKNEAA